MFIVFLLGMLLLLADHPIVMVSGLIMYTFVISFISYFSLFTFWFGCLFMLVVLSGMLVLFTYMASLVPNDLFFFDYMGGFIMFLLAGWFWLNLDINDHSSVSLRLWMSFDGILNIYVLVMLLVSMLVVVWISSFWSGPIRV